MDTNENNDPVKNLFSEIASDNLKNISKKILSIDKENRLKYVRASNPPSPLLKKVYEIAKEDQDFEVCEVTKQLLWERGIQISND